MIQIQMKKWRCENWIASYTENRTTLTLHLHICIKLNAQGKTFSQILKAYSFKQRKTLLEILKCLKCKGLMLTFKDLLMKRDLKPLILNPRSKIIKVINKTT